MVVRFGRSRTGREQLDLMPERLDQAAIAVRTTLVVIGTRREGSNFRPLRCHASAGVIFQKALTSGLVHGCRSCEGAADRIGRRPVPDRHDRSTLCRTSTMPSAAIIFPRSSTGCATGGTTKLGCAGAGP